MLFGLQVLVISTSMVVVAFVTLLQNPVLGSPSWLPLLAFCWAAAFVVTMVLQASLPLPDIQRCGAAVAPLQFTCMQVSFAGMHRMNKPPCLGYTILSSAPATAATIQSCSQAGLLAPSRIAAALLTR